jgi:hypothetical protein
VIGITQENVAVPGFAVRGERIEQQVGCCRQRGVGVTGRALQR